MLLEGELEYAQLEVLIASSGKHCTQVQELTISINSGVKKMIMNKENKGDIIKNSQWLEEQLVLG